MGVGCHLISGVGDLPFDDGGRGGAGAASVGGMAQGGAPVGGSASAGEGGIPSGGAGGIAPAGPGGSGGSGGSGGLGGAGGGAGLAPGTLGGECLGGNLCNEGTCCTDDACDTTCMTPCSSVGDCPGTGGPWICEHNYCLYSCTVDAECEQPGFVCHHSCTACESKTTQGCI